MKHEVTQHPIHPVLIGGHWYVENTDTSEVWGPFASSWTAIEKTQQLRGCKTAETAKIATNRNTYRYER